MVQNNETTGRIPSLDGLRAVSIGLVLFAHLCGTSYFPVKQEFFYVGNLGVRVFFVISGFLITSILLNETEKTGTVNFPKFYYRRTLRIFPPYYFFLLVAGFAALCGLFKLPLNEWLAAVFFASNFMPVSAWEIGHTWSLGVEEQFYLLMPGLLFFGKRRTLFILCAVVIGCPFIRFGTLFLFPDSDIRWIVLGFQANADSLATGCLLAFLRAKLWKNVSYQKLLRSKIFIVFPLLPFILNYFIQSLRIQALIGITLTNFCTVLCIDWVVKFHDGSVGKILNTKPLVYVGTLSYSLYLWQQLFLNRQSAQPANAFPLNLLLTVACAISSYYLIEKPSLKFRQKLEKRFFLKRVS
jgi:peptidoglycan/LPS O-acetylase OafA/YrhL